MNRPTIRELQKQLGQLNLLVEEARQREKQAVLAEIGEHVNAYGISEIELLRAAGFIQAKRKKAPAKYYDPDTGQSWSGNGPRPKWLVGKN
ncbi:H-NS histone family protein, partial [Ralstonia pickettii]|nr:H-NS histone family protein [Ralstonia pickettii]